MHTFYRRFYNADTLYKVFLNVRSEVIANKFDMASKLILNHAEESWIENDFPRILK